MKKLVTYLSAILCLLSISQQAEAQQSIVLDGRVRTEIPKPIPVPFNQGPQAPQDSRTTQLYYTDETQDLAPWTLPRLINFTEETDTVMTFMMRMTNPFPGNVIYLDSISAWVQANRVVDAGNNNLHFLVYYAQEPNPNNGVIYPSKAAGASKTVLASTVPLGEPVEVGVHFRNNQTPTGSRRKLDFNTTWDPDGAGPEPARPVHPTDFFIGVGVTYFTDLPFDPENEDNQQNDIALLGDLLEDVGDYDPEAHRGIGWARRYWFPWRLNSEEIGPFYSNFAFKAYVSEAVRLDVAEENATTFSLRQNYPNPFNPSTEIKYSLKETMPVSIKVFNTMGVEVASLVNETKAAGPYSVTFDASNLPSGNYIYTMTAGGETITKAMTLSK